MAKNEIVRSDVLSVSKGRIELPDFTNINLGDEPRRLRIKCRTGKTASGKIFNSITGYVKLPVYDGDDFVGVKVKRISVHFRKNAFKDAMNVHSPEELKSGYLYVKAKGLRLPSVWKVREETDKDGNIIYNEDGTAKLKYPEIWIESDVIGLQEFVTSQKALDIDEEDNVMDAEVEEPVDDSEAVADLENEELDEEETNLE